MSFAASAKTTQEEANRPANAKTYQTANTTLASKGISQDPFTTGVFRVCVVIRTEPATQTVVVTGPGCARLACMILAPAASYYFGVSDCIMPVEGSRVLVYQAKPNQTYGVVMGVLPSTDAFAPINKEGTAAQEIRTSWTLESSATGATERAYTFFHEEPNRREVLNGPAGRPIDALPGTRMIVNHHGVGIAVLNFMAALKATELAKVEVSLVDDLVRIHSGHFQHFNAAGSEQLFNDGGFITHECEFSMYQCHAAGYEDYGTPAFEYKKTIVLPTGTESRHKPKKPNTVSKKRFRSFMGYLGDMVSWFVGKPDPSKDPETLDDPGKDQGLLETHVDSSGRVMVRSAGGISLQRWDRIPVPKRIKQPWDPDGDKMEDDTSSPMPKSPVAWPTSDLYARNLQLRDANAWRTLQNVKRLHDQSTKASPARKDFEIPEESELSTPDDVYDTKGQANEDFRTNDLRQSFINMEDDGSIIIRDAWGSEIHMRGGNIVFTCPGQIEMRPGKSLVALAGHDIVARARQSVDIMATEKDVRIKANTNLHMLSEGREDEDTGVAGGGVLIESKSEYEAAVFGRTTGEDVQSRGIILKAEKSRVVAKGKTVHLASPENIILETFNADDKTDDGDILIACGRLIASTSVQTTLSCKENSALQLHPRQAWLAGTSAYLVAGTSVGIVRDSKAWVPLTEVSIETDPYADVQTRLQTLYAEIQLSVDWLTPYRPSDWEDIKFTYRSSSEYGTATATEVYGATRFMVYEAPWVYLTRSKAPMLANLSLEEWQEYEIDGTFPWPGYTYYNGSGQAYAKLDKEVNIDKPDTGIPKARKDRVQNIAPLKSPEDFSKYEVVAHT